MAREVEAIPGSRGRLRGGRRTQLAVNETRPSRGLIHPQPPRASRRRRPALSGDAKGDAGAGPEAPSPLHDQQDAHSGQRLVTPDRSTESSLLSS